jgi:tripartite-type tricarboxylate transporter receptor subunit TctC
MTRLKRQFLISAICALTAVSASSVLAQTTYPNKPVTITTAFAAGSGPDAVLRQVSDKLSKLWNQPVLVNNKPGGGRFHCHGCSSTTAS